VTDGATPTQPAELPSLASGDRLGRSEFERRYAAMSPAVRAELIGGIVYVASPTRAQHGRPHADLVGWLVTYRASTPGTEALDDSTARLSEEDEPKPDAMLRILPRAGGATRDDEDGYLSGPAELVGEVALSSAAYDLHQKLEAYQRAGCVEYVVVVLHSREIRWFRLEEGTYVPHPPDADGVHRSRVYPGLWLDSDAFLRGDMARVLEVLNHGLESSAHLEFARALTRRMDDRGYGA